MPKAFLPAVFSFIIAVISLQAAQDEFRNWMTADGKQFADLKFEQFAKGKLALKNREDVRTVVDLKDLSVVDRLFLIDECSVPESELLEGYQEGIEAKYKVPSGVIEKKSKALFESSGGKIELGVTDTPHFRILTEGRVDAKEYGEYLEQLWFYQAYRNPVFRKENSNLRTVVTILTTEEGVDDFYDWMSGAPIGLREGVMERLMTDKAAKVRSIPLPRDYCTKEGVIRQAYLIRTDETDFLDKERFRISAAFPTFLMRTHGIHKIFNAEQERGAYFFHGVGFDSEVTIHETIGSGFSFDGNGAHAWGEPRKWSKKLAKALEKGEVNYTLNDYCTASPALMSKPFFGEYVTGVSMFLRSDMKKEISTARILTLASGQNDFPEFDKFIATYGYSSAGEMEQELLEYLEDGKLE